MLKMKIVEFTNSICLDPNEVAHLDLHCLDVIGYQTRSYNTFSMLKSAEHEILNAHKYKNIKNFSFL